HSERSHGGPAGAVRPGSPISSPDHGGQHEVRIDVPFPYPGAPPAAAQPTPPPGGMVGGPSPTGLRTDHGRGLFVAGGRSGLPRRGPPVTGGGRLRRAGARPPRAEVLAL